jgi:hypothetical protein
LAGKSITRPDFPDTTELPDSEAIEELKNTVIDWVDNRAESLDVTDVIGAVTEEIFVPYSFGYPDILRSWLELHSRAKSRDNDQAMILLEKIIETTILDHKNSGDLIKETL